MQAAEAAKLPYAGALRGRAGRPGHVPGRDRRCGSGGGGRDVAVEEPAVRHCRLAPFDQKHHRSGAPRGMCSGRRIRRQRPLKLRSQRRERRATRTPRVRSEPGRPQQLRPCQPGARRRLPTEVSTAQPLAGGRLPARPLDDQRQAPDTAGFRGGGRWSPDACDGSDSGKVKSSRLLN